MKNKIDIKSTASERIPLSFEEKSVWIQFLEEIVRNATRIILYRKGM